MRPQEDGWARTEEEGVSIGDDQMDRQPLRDGELDEEEQCSYGLRGTLLSFPYPTGPGLSRVKNL